MCLVRSCLVISSLVRDDGDKLNGSSFGARWNELKNAAAAAAAAAADVAVVGVLLLDVNEVGWFAVVPDWTICLDIGLIVMLYRLGSAFANPSPMEGTIGLADDDDDELTLLVGLSVFSRFLHLALIGQ